MKMVRPTRLAAILVLAGAALLLSSLVMPWSSERSCPLFEDCGPYETQKGWAVGGPPMLVVGLALLVAGAAALPSPKVGAISALVAAILAALSLAMTGFMADFTVFGDVEFPRFGYLVSWMACLIALAGSILGLVRIDANDDGELPAQG